MLDTDLAELYGVTIGNLNKAVTRNTDRLCFLPNQGGIQVFKIPNLEAKREDITPNICHGFYRTGRRHAL